MAHRRIKGLRYVQPLADRPSFIPEARLRGVRQLGARYEREIEKALPEAKRGQWFEFVDQNGQGYCQVDFMLKREGYVVLLEAKHTWTPVGHLQLEELYRPVVEKLLGVPAIGVVVCKRLNDEVGALEALGRIGIAGRLEEAVERAVDGSRSVWHFIGGAGRRAGMRPAGGRWTR